MSRLDADEEMIKQELNDHWEVISEGAQTILRAAGRSDAYESLKSQMRGRVLNESNYRRWAESLDVDEKTRARLLKLSPESYIGLAVELVDKLIERKDKQIPPRPHSDASTQVDKETT
jgi:adenylosuccinate lyase